MLGNGGAGSAMKEMEMGLVGIDSLIVGADLRLDGKAKVM